ncbi:TetR/AcrR family transcriptional regulator [Clostridium felsineum]|uniref:TetR/AcrR family transcriptional regulator n=1 Tax=Clostridium felsineum TaxID=36839 RepID=UPI00098C8534|nr:TetR/AcrR family transcriptional regulator [Clostridium felsineum]URZ17463.1 HTH-type transcriptional regulator BetI [Clostridium felsineum DSM 794]
MGIKERKEREKDELKRLIIDTANEIILKEGLEKLSIRKIAAQIEYSPAIIYHYFKDKDEIVNTIMKQNYEKIINTVSSIKEINDTPENAIKYILREYINLALEMDEEYVSIMLSNSKDILEHTALLFKGAASKRKALNVLYKYMKQIYSDKNIDDREIELTCQIVWTSSFGLIIKLIVEKSLSHEQKNEIINHHLTLMVDGIILGSCFLK